MVSKKCTPLSRYPKRQFHTWLWQPVGQIVVFSGLFRLSRVAFFRFSNLSPGMEDIVDTFHLACFTQVNVGTLHALVANADNALRTATETVDTDMFDLRTILKCWV